MRHSSSRSAARVAALAFLAALLLWAPAFRFPFATGFGDWQFFLHMWEAGYVAITRYGEWPLWDPYHCGGITIFGNPQSQHLSPLYLIALVVGPTLGSKIFVVVHAWAGLAGMYVLARRQGLSLPAALLAALAWSASGFFIWHVSTGHAAFLPFYFAPWLILSLRASLHDIRYAAALAALLTLVLLEGGVYPFPFFVLLIAFDALCQLERNRERVLSALLVAAVLCACMAALRLWPILDELARSPRTMPSVDGVSLSELVVMLTAPDHSWRWEGHEFVWAEYGSYVGWGVCALGSLGALLCWRRGSRSLLFGALLFLALLLGDHGRLSAWSLLHELPVYDSLRVPSRFAVFFTLYLALLAGVGLDAVTRMFARLGPLSKGFAYSAPGWMLLLLISADLAWVQYPTLDKWHYEPVRTDWQSPNFYFSNLSYGDVYASLPRMNLGSRECYEAMNFRPAHGLWVGDRPQARVLRVHGVVGPVQRTTSHAWFDVTLDRPGRVLLNHNYAPGWETNLGRVESEQGRLAVDLPSGSQHVVLSYRPSMLWPSLALSLLGVVLALLLLRYGECVARYTGHSGASSR
jgi:hypothetical protein